MRTLAAYAIGVIIVLAIANGNAWDEHLPRLHGLIIFSAGFVMGMIGTCLASFLNGYRRIA